MVLPVDTGNVDVQLDLVAPPRIPGPYRHPTGRPRSIHRLQPDVWTGPIIYLRPTIPSPLAR